MAGYIGAKQGVTQVDGYNRSEADAEFVQTAGDTMTGALAVNGNLTVDTNTLFVDAANNRVGVGTSSPATKLDVSGTGNTAITIQDSTGVAFLDFTTGAGTQRILGGAGGTNTMLFYTGLTERMRIDSAGRVTMPYQPAFTVWQVGAGTPLTGNLVLTTVLTNIGGHYSTSTGRFTAPVAGTYYFSLAGFTENNGTTSGDVSIYRNGSLAVRVYTSEPSGTYRPFAVHCVLTLSAGDFVNPNSGLDLHSNNNPVFSGHLIG